MKLLERLEKERLIHPPAWLAENTHYITIMGSVAYGASSDTSDMDLYGFAIPPKDMVFPHTAGVIMVPYKEGQWRPMHGTKCEGWPQWQQHGVVEPSSGKTYDFSIYNIVRYFDLLIENNPNMLDSLFTAQECVLHATHVAIMVRENRRLFLHKGCWTRFKQYAISQMHKMQGKEPIGKRVEIREKFGFDVKFAYNIVRLLNECEQILTVGDVDLRQINEHLKAIRRGEISQEEIVRWASEKELQLEKMFAETKLPENPPMGKIKALLMACLEEHYGKLEGCLIEPDAAITTLRDIQKLLDANHAAIWSSNPG